MDAFINWIGSNIFPLIYSFLTGLFIMLVKTFAERIGAWIASKAGSALDHAVNNMKSKTQSEAVKAALDEARAVLQPLVVEVAMTSSKAIKEMAADGKITQEEAIQKLAQIGQDVKLIAHRALADWKMRMKPILTDPDKIVDSLVEEVYQVVKRNFEIGSSRHA